MRAYQIKQAHNKIYSSTKSPLPFTNKIDPSSRNFLRGEFSVLNFSYQDESTIKLINTSDARPSGIARFLLNYAQPVVQSLYLANDLTPFFEYLLDKYNSVYSRYSTTILSCEQALGAARVSVGNWNASTATLLNFVGRVAAIGDHASISSAWKLLNSSRGVAVMSAALMCLMSSSSAIVDKLAGIRCDPDPITYNINVKLDDEWQINCTQKLVKQISQQANKSDSAYSWVYEDQVVHDFKPLSKMVIDDEVEQALESLASM